MGDVELREVGDDEALLGVVADLTYATQPEWCRSVAHMRSQFGLDPGLRRVVALREGDPVGYASVGRIWMLSPDAPHAWSEIGVLEGHRRRGIGAALLAWARGGLPALGKRGLQVPCSDGRPEGIGFLLRRGFEEYDRMATVALSLDGVVPPPVHLPEGVRLTSLAAEPGLIASAYAAAVEAYTDLPDPEPVHVGDLDEWRRRDVEHADGPLDGYLLAVADGEVVGFTRLIVQERGDAVGHLLTGVRRDWRGRGVATGLKHAAIGWALERGAQRMTAENAFGNAPMRAVNRALGYRSRPDFVELREPLA